MISRLHYITQNLPEIPHEELTELACMGGIDWVQLRIKLPYALSPDKAEYKQVRSIAEETKIICTKFGAKLIINDHILIAKEISADGVHVGRDDMNPKEVRKFLGRGVVIGGSTNTEEDIKRRIEEGCDYIGIGPFRFTSTKDKLNPILGLEGIEALAKKYASAIPMIAIGGIELADIDELLNTGIYGVAVSSAINKAKNITDAAGKFSDKLLR